MYYNNKVLHYYIICNYLVRQYRVILFSYYVAVIKQYEFVCLFVCVCGGFRSREVFTYMDTFP